MDREEKTRSFRHDIKNHIYVMNILYSKNEIGKLGDYLSSLNEDLKELSPSIVTGHPLVDVIIGDVLCHHENVHFTSTGQLPDELSLSSKDICTIFYNLLNNACEAAENTKIREVSLYVLIRHKNLHMRIVNSIDEKPIINHGVIATSKSNDFHGYGLPNARSCIKKNNGMLNVYCNDDSFVTDITLFSAL
jgi:sensor histidine kinase regulating citrate/malate metabolism